jgi:hypothetical protein
MTAVAHDIGEPNVVSRDVHSRNVVSCTVVSRNVVSLNKRSRNGVSRNGVGRGVANWRSLVRYPIFVLFQAFPEKENQPMCVGILLNTSELKTTTVGRIPVTVVHRSKRVPKRLWHF